MARTEETYWRVRKDDLAELVGESHRDFAKRVAGDGASKRTVERRRRDLLRYLTEEDAASEVGGMTPETALKYAAALGVDPTAFADPPVDPRVRRLARLEDEARQLRAEIAAEHEQNPVNG